MSVAPIFHTISEYSRGSDEAYYNAASEISQVRPEISLEFLIMCFVSCSSDIREKIVSPCTRIQSALLSPIASYHMWFETHQREVQGGLLWD